MEDGWRTYHARWEERHWCDRAMDHWDFYRRFHGKLRRHLRSGDALLDVGSGKGYSAFHFAALGHPVTGIDPDAASVEEANEWARRLSLPARFFVADIFQFSVGERYRLSYSMGLIEHYSPEEAARMLRVQAGMSDLVAALAPTSHSDRTTEPCPVPWTSQTSRSLRRTFRSAGLEVIETFGAGDVSSPWDNRVKNLLPHGMLRILQDRFGYAMGVCAVGKAR